MIIRTATRKDFIDFYERAPPMTMRAWVADDNGELLGIGGYYLQGGHAVTFTDHREQMTKRDRVKSGHFLVNQLKKLRIGVIACTEHASVLKHFGFEPFGPVWRLR